VRALGLDVKAFDPLVGCELGWVADYLPQYQRNIAFVQSSDPTLLVNGSQTLRRTLIALLRITLHDALHKFNGGGQEADEESDHGPILNPIQSGVDFLGAYPAVEFVDGEDNGEADGLEEEWVVDAAVELHEALVLDHVAQGVGDWDHVWVHLHPHFDCVHEVAWDAVRHSSEQSACEIDREIHFYAFF